MRVTENPLAAEEIVRSAQARREQESVRSPGLHVSDLIYCLRQRHWKGNDRSLADSADVALLLLFLIGHGYHALLERGRTEIEVPLRLPSGDVVATIDYIPEGSSTPHEIKSTRYSSKKPVAALGHYIDQLAAYCVAQKSLTGTLVILHLNGDWGKERQPCLKVHEIEFTRDELNGWYRELDRRARILLSGQLPPLDEHQGWECRYCPFGPQGDRRCEGGPGRVTGYFVDEDVLERGP